MDSLVAANTKFCFDLFQEISKDDHHKNVFFSPLSLSAALGMVRLGARNDSAHQIDEVCVHWGATQGPKLWVHTQSQMLIPLRQAKVLIAPWAWLEPIPVSESLFVFSPPYFLFDPTILKISLKLLPSLGCSPTSCLAAFLIHLYLYLCMHVCHSFTL